MKRQIGIAVDVGNSALKIAAADLSNFSLSQPLAYRRVDPRDPQFDPHLRDAVAELLAPFDADPHREVQWRIASVQRIFATQLDEWIAQNRPGEQTAGIDPDGLGIAIAIPHPGRVGIDRLLAATAAHRLQNRPADAIVIDAGSAVTVDLIRADGTYCGGAILPGRQLQLESLAGGTDLLPLIQFDSAGNVPAPAGCTADAIRLGISAGIAGAVGWLSRRYGAAADCDYFLSGGDARWLAPLLDAPATMIEDLVLRGIFSVTGRP